MPKRREPLECGDPDKRKGICPTAQDSNTFSFPPNFIDLSEFEEDNEKRDLEKFIKDREIKKWKKICESAFSFDVLPIRLININKTLLMDFLNESLDERDKLIGGNVNLKYYLRKVLQKRGSETLNNIHNLSFDRSTDLKDFIVRPVDIDRIRGIPIKDMKDMISHEGKITYLWYGYTYELRDKNTGIHQTGISTMPNSKRKGYYKKDIIENYLSRENCTYQNGQTTIYGIIFNYLDSIGDFSKRNLDGKIKIDNEGIIQALNRRFEFIVTGVYWSEEALKLAETDQIMIGRLDCGNASFREILKKMGRPDSKDHIIHNALLKYGIVDKLGIIEPKVAEILEKYALDKSSVGTGLNQISAAGVINTEANKYFLLFIQYTGLGYTTKEMFNRFKENHGYKGNLGVFEQRIKAWVKNISTLREYLLNPLIEMLKREDHSWELIHELIPIRFEVDEQKFFRYAEQGLDMSIIAKDLGYPSKGVENNRVFLSRWCEKMIRKRFPNLKIYKKKDQKNYPSYEDLKEYFRSSKLFEFAMCGYTVKEAMHETRFSDHTIKDICMRVFECDYSTLRNRIISSFIGKVIINTPISSPTRRITMNHPNGDDFIKDYCVLNALGNPKFYPNTLSRDMGRKIYDPLRKIYLQDTINNRTLLNLENYEIRADDQENILRIVKIGVIGTILEKSYRNNLSYDQIREKYRFFRTIDDVKHWTELVFKESANDLVDHFTKTGNINPYWNEMHGVSKYRSYFSYIQNPY